MSTPAEVDNRRRHRILLVAIVDAPRGDLVPAALVCNVHNTVVRKAPARGAVASGVRALPPAVFDGRLQLPALDAALGSPLTSVRVRDDRHVICGEERAEHAEHARHPRVAVLCDLGNLSMFYFDNDSTRGFLG